MNLVCNLKRRACLRSFKTFAARLRVRSGMTAIGARARKKKTGLG